MQNHLCWRLFHLGYIHIEIKFLQLPTRNSLNNLELLPTQKCIVCSDVWNGETIGPFFFKYVHEALVLSRMESILNKWLKFFSLNLKNTSRRLLFLTTGCYKSQHVNHSAVVVKVFG